VPERVNLETGRVAQPIILKGAPRFCGKRCAIEGSKMAV
jgi:hypothetical protein